MLYSILYSETFVRLTFDGEKSLGIPLLSTTVWVNEISNSSLFQILVYLPRFLY